jgi:hypothetical protein
MVADGNFKVNKYVPAAVDARPMRRACPRNRRLSTVSTKRGWLSL